MESCGRVRRCVGRPRQASAPPRLEHDDLARRQRDRERGVRERADRGPLGALDPDELVRAARVEPQVARLDGHVADILARPAVAAGVRSVGIVVTVCPDAEDRLGALRAALDGARSDCGASAWNGLLTARFLGTPEDVRRDIIKAVEVLAGRAMPRTWMT